MAKPKKSARRRNSEKKKARTKRGNRFSEDDQFSSGVKRIIAYQRNKVENKAGIALAREQSRSRQLDLVNRP